MITDYSSLQTAVIDQIHRTDLSTKLPDFIQLAEGMIFRELNLSEMETSVTGTATEYIAIPADMGEMGRLEITYSGRRMTLDYTSPNGIDWKTVATGVPGFYTVESNQIRLIPSPAGSITYKLFYVPEISALSVSNTTNWLLTNAPDLYLYATCVEAARYMEDEQSVARYLQFVATMLDSVRRKDERRRLSGSGTMQIKVRNPV